MILFKEVIFLNIPNKLTLLRIFLIPVFVLVFYLSFLDQTITILNHKISWENIIGVIIFSIAAYTDRLDGHIARKNNIVTTFGKFMDPLADKLLVASAFIMAVELHLMPAFIPIIIIAREFMVTGIRLLAISDGKVIAASSLGKIKTVSQIVLVIVLFVFDLRSTNNYLIFTQFDFLHLVADSLMVITTFFTVISGLDYLRKNKAIILLTK